MPTAIALSRSRGPNPRRRTSPSGPIVPHAVLGMLLFLGTEVMFFASLISAFLVLRAGAAEWPPSGQPRLPVALTAVNTAVLLASGVTMWWALRAARTGDGRTLARRLGVTAALGSLFLLVQGTEWVRLLAHGLGVATSLYAATFYALIGAHGLHVAGGLGLLVVVWRRAATGRYTASEHAAVDASAIYWFFVVGIWPLLYGLVYLA